MTTLRSEFVELAAELIGDEFAAFASDCVITRGTGFDPDLQTETTQTQNIQMIRVEFSERSIDDSLVKAGDYKLIGEYQKLSWVPSADNTKTLHDGITANVVNVESDPANATIVLHVRRA